MTGQEQLSPVENLMVGSFSGALETCLQMPILTYKFCRQEGRSLPKSVSGWYRGVGVQAGTVAPITAIQFMTNGLLQKMVLLMDSTNDNNEQRALSDVETIATAATAGAVSALIYSPVDLMTIQQQKLSMNPIQTVRHILSNYGIRGLYRGFASCAVRESIYTAGYLGFSPVLLSHLMTKTDLFQDGLTAKIIGSCVAGATAAIITHPVDTAKTVIQADIGAKEWKTARHAAKVLYTERGWNSLFVGVIPRTIRLCGAFFICTIIREMAIDTKTERFLKNKQQSNFQPSQPINMS